MALLDNIATTKAPRLKAKLDKPTQRLPDAVYDRIVAHRKFEVMRWEYEPGEFVEVRIEPLSYREHEKIRLQARNAVVNRGYDPNSQDWVSEYEQELAAWVLWKAVRHPTKLINEDQEIYEPCFTSTEHIKRLTIGQIEKLYRLYETACSMYEVSKIASDVVSKNDLDTLVSFLATAAEKDAKKVLSALSLQDSLELTLTLSQMVHTLILSPSQQSANGSKSNPETSKSATLSGPELLTNTSDAPPKERARKEAVKVLTKRQAIDAQSEAFQKLTESSDD